METDLPDFLGFHLMIMLALLLSGDVVQGIASSSKTKSKTKQEKRAFNVQGFLDSAGGSRKIVQYRRSQKILCDCFWQGRGLYMSKSYSAWVGRQVVLQIETGKSQVPLRGQVVNESSIAVRFRLDGCWDVDIFKEMILRVEADTYGAFHPSSLGPSNKALSASRSGSTAMLNWNRGLDLWCSKNLSWQLCWKTFISTGLAGSVLFVLALHVSVSEPATHFAHFICGYLGLLFCAVSLSCGVLAVNYSVKPQSHIFAKWSKPFASFLDWLRQPIHL